MNVADLARSVLLLVPKEDLKTVTDPGEPDPKDREAIILKSGPSAGRPWKRKPRLQARLPEGFDPISIRKALALALEVSGGKMKLTFSDASADLEKSADLDRVETTINALALGPLPGGINSRADALYILGFPPGSNPDQRTLRQRFRSFAQIHHPDGNFGDHQRMAQLNTAMEMLRRS